MLMLWEVTRSDQVVKVGVVRGGDSPMLMSLMYLPLTVQLEDPHHRASKCQCHAPGLQASSCERDKLLFNLPKLGANVMT